MRVKGCVLVWADKDKENWRGDTRGWKRLGEGWLIHRVRDATQKVSAMRATHKTRRIPVISAPLYPWEVQNLEAQIRHKKSGLFPSLLLTTDTLPHLPFSQESKVLFFGEGERKESLQIQGQEAQRKTGKGAGLKMELYGNLHRNGKLSSPFLCLTSEMISQAYEFTPLPADNGWIPSEDTDRLWKEPLQTDICVCFCGVEFQD